MLLRSLILTGAINSLFFILLLKSKLKSTNSDRLLMLWMGIIAMQLLFYYDNLSANPFFPIWLQLLAFSLPLISSPVFYFYIASLSFGAPFKWQNLSGHLIPFLVFNCISFWTYYTIPPDYLSFTDGLPHFNSHINLGLVYTLTTPLAVIPAYYTVSGFIVLLKHKKMLADNYSYTEEINLNWLNRVVISLVILFIVLFFLIKYGPVVGLISYPNLFAVVGTILTIYIFFIGFYGLKQNTLLHENLIKKEIKEEDSITPSYKNSGLSDERVDQLYMALIRHMDDKKPYLKEDLSLSILAGQVKISANQLSQVINQKSHANFFNFINGYRVRDFKDKLKDPALSNYSILGLAYDCGFRSKSSFNKIFKETTGQTPIEYKKTTG